MGNKTLSTHRILFVVALLAVGCSRKSEPDAARAEAPPAPVTVTKAATVAPGPIRPSVTLSDQLENERAVRPTDTPRVEDVLAALDRAGVATTDRQQHVATIFGARYCMGAKSGDVAFSVCEYESASAAEAGRRLSLKALGATDREIVVNHKTTLTVRRPSVRTAASEDVAKKSIATFMGA